MTVVRSVHAMEDESLILHFENRHADDLAMEFWREPDRNERRLAAPREWRTYHETLHRLMPEKYDHEHEE